jgi:hypothetical protein
MPLHSWRHRSSAILAVGEGPSMISALSYTHVASLEALIGGEPDERYKVGSKAGWRVPGRVARSKSPAARHGRF